MTRDVLPAMPHVEGPVPIHGGNSKAEAVGPCRPHTAHVARKRVTILFVAANPAARGPLALDTEYRAIEQSIQGARHRDAFRLIPKLAARLSDLQQALLEHCPDVVHFACHGSPDAELVLLSDERGIAPVPATALASIFGVLKDNVALVVFNACFASEQAEAIHRTTGLAIGMRARIEDSAAIAFASSLYRALAYGRSVQEAFELGRAAVEAIDSRQKEIPQLLSREGLDARTAYLVDPRPRRPLWKYGAIGGCFLLASAWFQLPGQGDVPPPPSDATTSFSASPSPIRGMVRFSGGVLRPGVIDAARRSPSCTSLKPTVDCAELDHPEQIREAHLESFDLDELEVTNLEVADWLNEHAGEWQITPEGAIQTRQEPAIALGRTTKGCGGGLTIAQDGRVRTDPEKANRPAACITWHGASQYCRAHGKRLPLEPEWELAAKGPEARPFPWGAEMPRQDGVTFGLRDSAAAHPRDVGSSPQDISREGVRDLGGNVAEWVEDNRDLKGVKTIRGGSWASRGACQVRGTGHKRLPAETSGPEIGFRCASSVIHRSPAGKDPR